MANELGYAQHRNPGFPALTCDHMIKYQRGQRCQLLGKGYQSRRASCLSFAVPRVRYGLSESRSLGVERKLGGKLLLKRKICLRPIANQYYEGKMHRTLKKSLKVPEITGRELSWTSFAW